MLSRRCLFAIAAMALIAGATAQGQDYPNRPIKVVIAFPPGGPTDFVGRLLADKLKDFLGQPVIIENKAGANGAIGANEVAKSAPDGYTLFLTTSGAVTITPNLRTDTPYDTLRDFAPITRVVNVNEVLVVRPALGVSSAKDLVAMAKAKPGTLTFASTGVGSPPHLSLELLQASAGVKFVHVPYRGAAPAITDLLGGQVAAMFADVPVLLPQIQSGKLKPLAVAATQRNPVLPDVPTLAEEGYANTVCDNWYGLLAPTKTPPAIIARLNRAMKAALADPDISARLLKVGAVPAATTPEEFGQFLRDEIARWGKVIRERGIKEE
jgi:tripartite-type tricarboxylate transporter receptor subunit TctC